MNKIVFVKPINETRQSKIIMIDICMKNVN